MTWYSDSSTRGISEVSKFHVKTEVGKQKTQVTQISSFQTTFEKHTLALGLYAFQNKEKQCYITAASKCN